MKIKNKENRQAYDGIGKIKMTDLRDRKGRNEYSKRVKSSQSDENKNKL